MDNLDNQPSSTPTQSDAEETSAQFASLASLLNSILVLVLVLAGVVDLFIVRQVKNTRADLTNFRAYVAQAQAQAQHNAPAIDDFARGVIAARHRKENLVIGIIKRSQRRDVLFQPRLGALHRAK